MNARQVVKVAFLFSIVVLTAALSVAAEAPARPGQSIPDVYVASNNSFVITVPNLTKVAVGNPNAVLANVISPTEVLIQGAPSVAQEGDGSINYAISNVFVWSGDRRYVYRVVVLEPYDDTAMPYGVDRMDIDPNKVTLRGNTDDMLRTRNSCRLFDAIGVRYEIKVNEVSFIDAMTSYANVDRAMVEEAIRRNLVIVGMTLDDVRRSQGGLPPVFSSATSDTRTMDIYRFADYDITVVNGVVVAMDRRARVPSALAAEAAANGIVLVNMTETEVIAALGPAPTAPTVTEVDGRMRREYAYPSMRVVMMEGRVVEVQSNHPPVPSSVVVDKIDLGTYSNSNGTFVGRGFRLQYISGAELVTEIDRMAKLWSATSWYTIGHRNDGITAVYADAGTIGIIESLVTILDRPLARSPLTIEETKYTIPAGQQWNAVSNTWDAVPAKQVGFLMARFSSAVSEDRRKAIADEMSRSVATLPTIPFAVTPSVNLSGATLTLTGTPEQVGIMRKILEGMIPDVVGRDLTAAIRDGQLMPGMTRQQVEASRGVRITDSGRRMQLTDGSLAVIYDLGDRAAVMSEDVLVEERLYPGADQVRNAVASRQLIPYLQRTDVERILGQQARQVTQNADGTLLAAYAFGNAVYWKGRLESMNGLAGSEMQRLNISVAVPRSDDNEFALLTPEEQLTVIKRGIVMTGMTERDVARVIGQSPFSIRPGDLPNEKTYVYADYEVTFRDGVAAKVTPTGDNSPRIVALRSRRATEMVSLISSSFADMSQIGLSADTVSNRLIVRAPNDRFIEIERFAKAMDQQEVPQVLIEAKFVELNRSIVNQLGVQWGLSTQADGGNRPFAGFGGSTSRSDDGQPQAGVTSGNNALGTAGSAVLDAGMLLGMFGGNGFSFSGLRYTNVDVMIAALESSGDAQVLSSPRIVTLNNQKATLKSIERVYDVTTTVEIDDVGTRTYSTTTTPKDVGITLEVNPTIGQDGIISLDLNALVSRVLRRNNYGAGDNVIIINEISERNSTSRVMVRSGTPLVIGGLTSRDQTVNEQKVPFLGSIPFLGRLFRSNSTTGSDVDLLIFLTARIVPPDGTISNIDRTLQQPRPNIPNPVPTTTLTPAVPASASGTAR